MQNYRLLRIVHKIVHTIVHKITICIVEDTHPFSITVYATKKGNMNLTNRVRGSEGN